MLTGDVRPKRTKLPAATARSAAFKGCEPAYADFLQLNSKLNLPVGLFRPSLGRLCTAHDLVDMQTGNIQKRVSRRLLSIER